MATYQCHVQTITPIRLGYSNLYEPRAFKPRTDDKKKTQPEAENKPHYSLNLAMDKQKDKKNIALFRKAQNEAMRRAVDDGEWDESDKATAKLAFKDCDTTKKLVKVGAKNTKMTIAEQNPKYEGKYLLSASSKASLRPQVRYIDKNGRIKPMPQPILSPDENDPREMAEADRIRIFWDEMVFSGQNAMVSVTYRPFATELSVGVSARIDWVLIIGGGVPEGQVDFNEDFDKANLDELIAWRNANTSFGDISTEGLTSTGTESDDDVDEDTGEILEEEQPARRRRAAETVDDDDVEEEDPAPRRRRKPAEEVEDDYEEEAPAPRRRKARPVELDEADDEEEAAPARRTRRTRRPAVVDDDFEEPDTF